MASLAPQLVASLLFLGAVGVAFHLSDRMFNLAKPISKPVAGIGVLFMFLLASLPVVFTLRAIEHGVILFGRKRAPNLQFSVLHEPIGYWFTFGLYLLLTVFLLAAAFQYTRHAVDIFRGRPPSNRRRTWFG